MAGGDLRAALDKDARRELVWGRKGQQVALDIARGIHFLHSHDVRDRFFFLELLPSELIQHTEVTWRHCMRTVHIGVCGTWC